MFVKLAYSEKEDKEKKRENKKTRKNRNRKRRNRKKKKKKKEILIPREANATAQSFLFQVWVNQLLTWDPAQYNGVKAVRLDPRLVWIPDIVLYNR